jgi:drug/metabolite transporter (DMT)-like permease
MSTRQLLPLIGALFALYIIWGSTYFAIAVGVASWPPLMMAGIRFLSAGVLLLGWLLATGHKLPARRPLLNAALIGVLLLAVGNGFVTLAEHQHVPPDRGGDGRHRAAVHPMLQPLFRHRHP